MPRRTHLTPRSRPKKRKRPRSWHRKAQVPLTMLAKELNVGVVG
ncbi:MAG: hypothetical protein A4E53_02371 [Pelotomaculum sp. PtaB.Bin104]|nr:MAG: hypothetical protein A4E53_02371 [Pelotomaculum sp. PtaB.Bin104]